MDRRGACRSASRSICSSRCCIRRSSNDRASAACKSRSTSRCSSRSRSRSAPSWPTSTRAGARSCRRSCGRSSGSIYRVAGIDEQSEVDWKRYAARRAALQPRRLRRRLSAAAAPGRAAAEPGGLRGRDARLVVQHGRELRDEHELAGLRRRVDDELSHADARPRRAELRLGRVGHGGARRADPRLRAPASRRRSATSGSTSRAARSTSCCRCRCCSRSC